MTIHYDDQEELHSGVTAADWAHEGVGTITATADGRGMDLACLGSKQGAQGCMAFFKHALPDQISVSYELTVHSQAGLVINYLALRGIQGESVLDETSGLPGRTGIMANYWAKEFGLQSYHLSFTRYNDKGVHTGTANIRRNPGGLLVGHGVDPIREVGRVFKLRITKDLGAVQLFVDGVLAMAAVDHATNLGPIPDGGHFGFRLVGDDVRATVKDFKVKKITAASVWTPWVFKG
jgi:hypothetical protein